MPRLSVSAVVLLLPCLGMGSDVMASNDGEWARFPLPDARSGHTTIYDGPRERIVAFGGIVAGQPSNELWTLDLNPPDGVIKWTRILTEGDAPTPRHHHAAVYDAIRGQMVVFGGYSNARLNDLWVLSLAGPPTWTQIQASGSLPSARLKHTLIYDRGRDRVVLFGGDAGTLQSDAWALDLSNHTWSLLSPSGSPPPPRSGHSAVFDRPTDRMIVFGGYGLNDLWVLTFGTSPAWSPLTPSGPTPAARGGHVAIIDGNRRMILFGGQGSGEFADRNDAHALSLGATAAWSPLSPSGVIPRERHDAGAVFDPTTQRMIVFGGVGSWDMVDVTSLNTTIAAEAWEPLPVAPTPSAGHTAILDEPGDAMVVLGDWSSVGLPDLWSMDLAGGTWMPIAATGPAPPHLWAHAAVFDASRRRMLVFGGLEQAAFFAPNKVWALDLATALWTELPVAGPWPPPRFGHTAIYDPVDDRMLVFGGQLGASSYAGDVWELRLGGTPTWAQITPSGPGPSARCFHTAVYDPIHHRIVVFGGYNLSYPDDLWELQLTNPPAWNLLSPAGPHPAGRERAMAIFDLARRRMVLHGGYTGGTEVWALELDGPLAWEALSPTGAQPPGRNGHAGVYDPQRDRMVFFGGATLGDAWALIWTTPLDVPALGGRDLGIALASSNPVRGSSVRFSYTLPEGGAVEVRIFDPSGRRLRTLREGHTTGSGSLVWDLRDEKGAAVRPGVYLADLAFSGRHAMKKLVIMR